MIFIYVGGINMEHNSTKFQNFRSSSTGVYRHPKMSEILTDFVWDHFWVQFSWKVVPGGSRLKFPHKVLLVVSRYAIYLLPIYQTSWSWDASNFLKKNYGVIFCSFWGHVAGQPYHLSQIWLHIHNLCKKFYKTAKFELSNCIRRLKIMQLKIGQNRLFRKVIGPP